MYDHIIVPVDFDHDDLVEQAVAVGKRLLAEGGTITLMHAVDDLPGYVATSIPAEMLVASRKEAEDKLHEMAEGFGSVCAAVMRTGSAGREILSVAKEKKAGCIIIASHKPGLQDYFLGSTAAWVVRHAPCCVHVLR